MITLPLRSMRYRLSKVRERYLSGKEWRRAKGGPRSRLRGEGEASCLLLMYVFRLFSVVRVFELRWTCADSTGLNEVRDRPRVFRRVLL